MVDISETQKDFPVIVYKYLVTGIINESCSFQNKLLHIIAHTLFSLLVTVDVMILDIVDDTVVDILIVGDTVDDTVVDIRIVGDTVVDILIVGDTVDDTVVDILIVGDTVDDTVVDILIVGDTVDDTVVDITGDTAVIVASR